jgi:cytochrome c
MLDALPLTQIKHDPPVGVELFGLICVKRDQNERDDSYWQVERTIQMSTQRRAFTPRILSILIISIIARSFPALADEESVRRGKAFAQTNCSRCHSIDRTPRSPRTAAPPFRTLHKRYPIETLEDALGEGLSTGHPRMPEFRLDPGQVGDFINFLKSLE